MDLSKLIFGGGPIKRRPKPKIRNRLQKLIKKHFFNKPKNKLDLIFVTKLARLAEIFETIFGEGSNIGKKYEGIKLNLWANQYLRDIQGKLLEDHNIKFEINYEKTKKGLVNLE